MPKLKIGAITFNVTYTTKPITIEGDDGEEYGCWGDIEYITQRIQIDKMATKERQQTALLHEVIHAIDKEYQTRLTEPTVSCLASGLMAAFKQNRWFREKLLNV